MSYQDFIISSAIKEFDIKKIGRMSSEYDVFFNEFSKIDKFLSSRIFLEFITLSLKAYDSSDIHSEIWLRNRMISPFLIEMEKIHDTFFIWEGVRLEVDKQRGLNGEPDYFVTKKADHQKFHIAI